MIHLSTDALFSPSHKPNFFLYISGTFGPWGLTLSFTSTLGCDGGDGGKLYTVLRLQRCSSLQPSFKYTPSLLPLRSLRCISISSHPVPSPALRDPLTSRHSYISEKMGELCGELVEIRLKTWWITLVIFLAFWLVLRANLQLSSYLIIGVASVVSSYHMCNSASPTTTLHPVRTRFSIRAPSSPPNDVCSHARPNESVSHKPRCVIQGRSHVRSCGSHSLRPSIAPPPPRTAASSRLVSNSFAHSLRSL